MLNIYLILTVVISLIVIFFAIWIAYQDYKEAKKYPKLNEFKFKMENSKFSNILRFLHPAFLGFAFLLNLIGYFLILLVHC